MLRRALGQSVKATGGRGEMDTADRPGADGPSALGSAPFPV